MAFIPEQLPFPHRSSAKTKETLVKEMAASKKPVSLWRDIWDLVKPDLLLLACIVLTAIGAAVVHLQTPVITGELIDVLTSSVKAASHGLTLSIQELNKPAIKLFSLLSAQGNRRKSVRNKPLIVLFFLCVIYAVMKRILNVCAYHTGGRLW